MAKNGKHLRALEEAKAAGYEVEILHFREPFAYPSKHGSGWVNIRAITLVALYVQVKMCLWPRVMPSAL